MAPDLAQSRDFLTISLRRPAKDHLIDMLIAKPPITSQPSWYFWSLYLLGWLVFAAAFAGMHIMAGTHSIVSALSFGFLVAVPAGLLGILVIQLTYRLAEAQFRPLGLVFIHTLTMVLYPALWILVMWSTRMMTALAVAGKAAFFMPPAHAVHWHYLAGVLIYLLLVALCHAMMSADARKRTEIEAEVRTTLAKFDPHFLFNTLNAIRHLLRTDTDLAEDAHRQLAILLRETVKADADRSHSLKRELELCRIYLQLQKMRLGNRLTVKEQIDDDTLDCEIPALILQPLIENAIGHGIEPMEAGGTIEIAANRLGMQLEVRLTNEMPPSEQESGHGAASFGLEYVKTRLRQFDPSANWRFEAAEGRYLAVIMLPAWGADD
ncbi:histidine kinase [Parasphingopyxis algicola]|uniref:sensor histidine kinase n=1 Tax=Parasphingopyxis algicola TaxID=2026624 RepID=UPI0015A1E0E1|nr:histidine kinase [Parasphingopyxis algicola]QLC25195.1 histidine kinase [Parasphingopyxis algicola]